MAEPFMEFHILIQKSRISRLESPSGKAVIIPFEGFVSSDLFTGRILPGAADVQTTDAAGIRHMCAKYMFEGKDSEGRFCHLFVENNGYFEKDSHPEVFQACPSFMSDSPLLAEALSGPWFRAEGHPADTGVTIRIFDVRKETETETYIPVRKGKDPAEIDPQLREIYAALSEERKQFVSETEKRILAAGEIEEAVFYYDRDAGTYVYEAGENGELCLSGMLGALYDSSSILFLIIDGKLCALYSSVGKIRDIPDDALMIFQQMLELQGGSVFERSLTAYRKIRLFG